MRPVVAKPVSGGPEKRETQEMLPYGCTVSECSDFDDGLVRYGMPSRRGIVLSAGPQGREVVSHLEKARLPAYDLEFLNKRQFFLAGDSNFYGKFASQAADAMFPESASARVLFVEEVLRDIQQFERVSTLTETGKGNDLSDLGMGAMFHVATHLDLRKPAHTHTDLRAIFCKTYRGPASIIYPEDLPRDGKSIERGDGIHFKGGRGWDAAETLLHQGPCRMVGSVAPQGRVALFLWSFLVSEHETCPLAG